MCSFTVSSKPPKKTQKKVFQIGTSVQPKRFPLNVQLLHSPKKRTSQPQPQTKCFLSLRDRLAQWSQRRARQKIADRLTRTKRYGYDMYVCTQ